MKEDVDETDRMIARLGDFLRLSMENIGTQVVAFEREVNFLKCYLEIEKIRTHNRLSYDLDLDPESMDGQIPNLLLQPLIESAVTQMRDDTAHVQISARRDNGNLRRCATACARFMAKRSTSTPPEAPMAATP